MSWIVGTLILWVLKAVGTMPLARLFARMSQPAPAVAVQGEAVQTGPIESLEPAGAGAGGQVIPGEVIESPVAGEQAVQTVATQEIPAGSYIVADLLVMSVAGLLLGLITGSWFIGISWKVRDWPGMIVFILGSLLGSALR